MAETKSTSNPAVEYRDIPGFPGYRVGNDGSVWSCRERHPARGLGARGSVSRIGNVWKPMALTHKSNGYLQVLLNSVTVGMKYKTFLVHRLVLTVFIGPCPPGMLCCHHDGDKSNNNLGNLRWDTPRANCADSARQGVLCEGERHGCAKLTEAEVLEIRANSKPKQRNKIALAKKFGVCKRTIKDIVTRKTWDHI